METKIAGQTLTGTWKVDAAHSNIDFSVSHLVISHVNGSFNVFDATLINQGENFEDARIEFTIDASSINTRNEMRDNHLKSDDFFNVAQYPRIRFTSTAIEKVSDTGFLIHGDLTIREVTRPVTFETRFGGVAVDGYGNTKLGLRASAGINRFDYNLKWNQLTETGGVTVGKEVEIVAGIQFAKQ